MSDAETSTTEPARPGRHRAWLIVGGTLAVVLVGLGAVQAAGIAASTTSTTTRTYATTGLRTVSVDVESGTVRVVGVPGRDDVEVRVRVRDGLVSVEHDVARRGDRLDVVASCPWLAGPRCSADHVIRVPEGIAVRIVTENGDVEARNLGSGLTVTSDNGDIDLAEIAGDITVATDNGDVAARRLGTGTSTTTSNNGDLTLGWTAAPRRVVAETDNGDVAITVPRGDEHYAVDATTDNGSARTAVRTDPDSDRRIRATSDNGDIDLRYG